MAAPQWRGGRPDAGDVPRLVGGVAARVLEYCQRPLRLGLRSVICARKQRLLCKGEAGCSTSHAQVSPAARRRDVQGRPTSRWGHPAAMGFSARSLPAVRSSSVDQEGEPPPRDANAFRHQTQRCIPPFLRLLVPTHPVGVFTTRSCVPARVCAPASAHGFDDTTGARLGSLQSSEASVKAFRRTLAGHRGRITVVTQEGSPRWGQNAHPGVQRRAFDGPRRLGNTITTAPLYRGHGRHRRPAQIRDDIIHPGAEAGASDEG
jgi:hypothetical protein